VSGIVGRYREFINALVHMLNLPHLPQAIYDTAGIGAFSVGRGVWIGRKVERLLAKDLDSALSDVLKQSPDLKSFTSHTSKFNEDMAAFRGKLSAASSVDETIQIARGVSRIVLQHQGRLVVTGSLKEVANTSDTLDKRYRLWGYSPRLAVWLGAPPPKQGVTLAYRILLRVGHAIIYGGLVACCIAAMFGIDFIYRQFA
jgi:hypothetical protein